MCVTGFELTIKSKYYKPLTHLPYPPEQVFQTFEFGLWVNWRLKKSLKQFKLTTTQANLSNPLSYFAYAALPLSVKNMIRTFSSNDIEKDSQKVQTHNSAHQASRHNL